MKSHLLVALIAIGAMLLICNFAYSVTYTLTQNTPLVFNQGTRSNFISASGVVGTITDVNVTLNGVRVNNFLQGISELDILLVGPHGQKIILMAYVCEAFTTPGPINFTFDRSAASKLPSGLEDPCVGGTYLPTDYAHVPPPHTYIFKYPETPAPPYSTNLADFHNTTANGIWTLYGAEDQGQ